MKGFPKHINSKNDILTLLKLYPDETKNHLQLLLDARHKWITIKKLTDAEEGITDKTHRTVEVKDMIDETKILERYQEEYKEDPNCKLFRLGFSVKEAESIIGEI